MMNFKKIAVWVMIMVCAVSTVCLLPGMKTAAFAEDNAYGEPLPWIEYGPEDPLTDEIFAKAQTELDKLHELGILNSEIKLDKSEAAVFDTTEDSPTPGSYGRTRGRYFYINCPDETGTAYVSVRISAETGKIIFFSAQVDAGDGDTLLDREPLDMGNGPVSYYDCFHRVLRDDITVNELCEALNGYWGFDGYTLGKTVDDFYGYDLEAPDGDMLMKDRIDGPFATVYFDGDEKDAPMFLEVMYFPGRVYLGVGDAHAVG